MFRIWAERRLPPAHSHLLEGAADFIGSADMTPEEPLAALPRAQAIIASARTRYDGDLMDRAPNLRVIARTGIGYDNIAVPDATSRGIAVCNAPDAPTISTAEHTITLMLAVAKDVKRMDRALRRGGTADFFSAYGGLEIDGRRLGLVGMGRIGRRVAGMARGLGMSVVAYDPYVEAAEMDELGVERAESLDEVLQTADVVSLHAPLTDETRHLLNAERLGLMKRGAILVNAARGGLVDQAALLTALDEGRLHGAGLDALDPEPPEPSDPLLQRDDVIASPHIGAGTTAGKARLWEAAISQVLQVLRGQRPPHLLNPEVWETGGS